MAKCPICKLELKEWEAVGEKSHLIITKTHLGNHIHVHGDLEDKNTMEDLLKNAYQEIGIPEKKGILDRKEFVFHNRQRIGDILVFTCAIRDFKTAYPDARVNIISTAMHIWDYNPYIDKTLKDSTENLIKIGPGKGTNQSNRIDWHFTNAYRISIEDALNIHIPQGESRPDIWLTQEEYDAPRVFDFPYWIIIVGGEKGWGCKMYPFERWQEFVNQNPDVNFVQLGSKGDNHPVLQGKNVTNYIGKTEDRNTGIRDLFKLFLNAEGSIGLVSFHMHLSGAFEGKPCIVVAGAREPVSFTQYAGHRYLSTDNCLPCGIKACWHCNIDTCTNLTANKVPKCVDLITPEDLTRALNLYYEGGRLVKGKISPKPKFKNVVPTPPKPIVPVEEPITDVKTKYGLEFGGGCLTEEDWKFIRDTIKENNIKTILEFGAGLSTLLLNELGIKVITYETHNGWVDKIKSLNDKCDVRLWDGNSIDNIEKFDFAFIDGPAGGANREFSTKIASEVANILIVHDAGREYEMKWQEKYIKGKFIGPGGGGKRCHLWSKNPNTKINFRTGSPLMLEPSKPLSEETIIPEILSCVIDNPDSKSIKFISTARGWGGCARSITTIMKMLSDKGHKVEFIPFRNSIGSREFKEWSYNNPKIKITENYSTLIEQCDVLMIYGDDYIWEFGQPEIVEAFSNLNATKKIMMLNYRRGGVGQIPWTKGWDKYMFLNSIQEKELLKFEPLAKTKVLPPCTDLTEFFKVQPTYSDKVIIVRHNSQGDTKFAKDCSVEINAVLERPDLEINMMPGPTFVAPNQRFKKFPKNAPPVPVFLGLGNLFWYSLPEGYMDMGPRVILEAMASGLPVIADNWGGAPDRVTSECGWICNSKKEQIDIIKNVTIEELKIKGQAARKRAQEEFITERWVKEIVE